MRLNYSNHYSSQTHNLHFQYRSLLLTDWSLTHIPFYRHMCPSPYLLMSDRSHSIQYRHTHFCSLLTSNYFRYNVFPHCHQVRLHRYLFCSDHYLSADRLALVHKALQYQEWCLRPNLHQ